MLTRRFEGLLAVNQANLCFKRNEIHAVIGTNGAGKSTLINMLSGELMASSGSIGLRQGEAMVDVSAWPQYVRARAGLGRSYQRNTIFPEFTVFENIRLCAQAVHPRAWVWWQRATQCPHALQAAEQALHVTGLVQERARMAGTLSHGAKRQLEVAMCLATQPQVLLLDEPLAGMGAQESERMLQLLAALKPSHAILLVEHDMDAVFRIADRISVMVNGEVIASDTPALIRGNPQVRVAYLGDWA